MGFHPEGHLFPAGQWLPEGQRVSKAALEKVVEVAGWTTGGGGGGAERLRGGERRRGDSGRNGET